MGHAVKAREDAVAGRFHDIGTRVAQPLHHLDAFMTDGKQTGFADNMVLEFNALHEIHLHMHKHHVHVAPVNRLLEHMLEIGAPSEVEIVALGSVVHMYKRIQVAHSHLDRSGKFVIVCLHIKKGECCFPVISILSF